MADTLSMLSLISFIVAGVCLILSILLGIVFRIPSVISDLSGRTAKRSITKMRKDNEMSGNKEFRSSAVNMKRGKLTETIPDMKNTDDENASELADTSEQPVTGVLTENKISESVSTETVVLENEETGLLEESGSTELLPAENNAPPKVKKELKRIDEVILIHTQEMIE